MISKKEAPVARPKKTLSGLVFSWAARRLEKIPSGQKLVAHVMRRLGFYDQAWSLTLAVSLAILLRATVVTGFYIPSESMLNTLQLNDRVFVNRLAYLFEKPQVGDIVVFKVPEDIPGYDPAKPLWIKRVVGVAGDRVEISENHLVVNGKKVTDPPFLATNSYFSHLRNGSVFPGITVPQGNVLVCGDNSADSYDSRYWGPIAENRILGKAFVRFWPLNRLGPIHGESVNPIPPGR